MDAGRTRLRLVLALFCLGTTATRVTCHKLSKTASVALPALTYTATLSTRWDALGENSTVQPSLRATTRRAALAGVTVQLRAAAALAASACPATN